MDSTRASIRFRFDDDGSGWIEYDEFLRHIYPEDFVRSRFTTETHRQLAREFRVCPKKI